MMSTLCVMLSGKRGRLTVEAEFRRIGPDVSAAISGGGGPHIGAVALAEPNGGVPDISVVRASEHRDDVPAALAAGLLCGSLGCRAAVCCGIHLDDITPQEIQDAVELTEALCRRACRLLQTCEADDSGSPA